MDFIMMFCPIKTTKSKKIHHQNIRGAGGGGGGGVGGAVVGSDTLNQVNHNNNNNGHSHLGYPSVNAASNGANGEKQAIALSKYRYVTAEFQAEAADELNVLPGDAVIYEYSDTDAGTSWSHVLCLKSGKQGFVPSEILSIEPVRNCKKKLPRSLVDSITSHHPQAHHHHMSHHSAHHHSSHHHHSSSHSHNHNHHQSPGANPAHLHSHLHRTPHPPHLHHQSPGAGLGGGGGGGGGAINHNQVGGGGAGGLAGGPLPPGANGIHLHHNGTGPGQHHHQVVSTQPSLNGDNTPQRSLIHRHVSELHPTQPNFMLAAPPSLHGSSINKQSFPRFPDLRALNSSGGYYNLRNSEPAYEHYEMNFSPFPRDDMFGLHIVITNFCAREENDLSVKPGEFVTVLNKDDPDWNWVRRECDHMEGFVPSRFLCDYEHVKSILNKGNSTVTMKSSNHIECHTYINHKPDRESLTTDQHSSSFQHI